MLHPQDPTVRVKRAASISDQLSAFESERCELCLVLLLQPDPAMRAQRADYVFEQNLGFEDALQCFQVELTVFPSRP